MSTMTTGDVGTKIALDCGMDISTSFTRRIHVRTPTGQKLTWAAGLEGSNLITYIVNDGDISIPGEWTFQAYVEMPGWKGYGAPAKILVTKPI